MTTITVREYARLTTSNCKPSLDRATVSEKAFDWLCELSSSFSKGGAKLLEIEGRRWLRLDSYVGILETPCGTRLEILPKHVDDDDSATVAKSRVLLRRMLEAALDLPPRESDEADVQLFDSPLSEWVMRRFLLTLDHLIKRGVRFDYLRVEEEQRFLRGQLDITRQMRQPPGREHLFQIRHDIFVANRPENRLLKTALMRVCRQTQEAGNWRLAHELAFLLTEIPESLNIQADFRQWKNDRLMAHYQPTKSWCELVLGQNMPLALQGHSRGLSLLFPMERLFERYVAGCLAKQIAPGHKILPQKASYALCSHKAEGDSEPKAKFTLQPDLLLTRPDKQQMVMDTKWKRLDSSNKDKHYDIKQSDFYQMFAYGQYYQSGKGDMLLIYPAWKRFESPLPVFTFQSDLRLWAVPFDLEARQLQLPHQLKPLFS